MYRLCLSVAALFLGITGFAQKSNSPAPIIFIYDASGSMWGQINGDIKMKIASTVLTEAVEKLDDKQQIGLVAYGHRQERDCEDVEFILPPENQDKSRVIQSLQGIKPLGRTPLAFSATKVINKLTNSGSQATIILITDGIESCGGNICDVIKKAKAEGIEFKLHIIGFGLKENETAQLKCASEAGNGNYYDANNADQLSTVLQEATTETVEELPKNVSVMAFKNGEAIDALIRVYPVGSSSYETSTRTYSDTGWIHLNPGVYNLVVTPLSNSDVASLTIADVMVKESELIHRSVSFDAGILSVTTSSNGEGWDAVVRIYNHNSGKRVTSGRTYGRTDDYELNPGIYDVEVAALKLKGLEIKYRENGIEVLSNQSSTMTHDFKRGTARIGAQSNGELIDVVIQILESKSKKNVSGGRTYTRTTTNPAEYLLTPGTYDVTLKGLADYGGINKSFTMIIKEGDLFERITQF